MPQLLLSLMLLLMPFASRRWLWPVANAVATVAYESWYHQQIKLAHLFVLLVCCRCFFFIISPSSSPLDLVVRLLWDEKIEWISVKFAGRRHDCTKLISLLNWTKLVGYLCLFQCKNYLLTFGVTKMIQFSTTCLLLRYWFCRVGTVCARCGSQPMGSG